MTYGCEISTLKKDVVMKLKLTQSSMEPEWIAKGRMDNGTII